jgi:hypothetical protein
MADGPVTTPGVSSKMLLKSPKVLAKATPRTNVRIIIKEYVQNRFMVAIIQKSPA